MAGEILSWLCVLEKEEVEGISLGLFGLHMKSFCEKGDNHL